MIFYLPTQPPTNSPKNKHFKKLKKCPGDIIILHRCAKNYDQTMYRSWDMVRDRYICYFSFWAIFWPFTPLTAQKIKILKKKIIIGDIIILNMCTKNYDQMMYDSWDMVRDGCNYFSSWAIFYPFTPLTTSKIKILKKWRKLWKVSSFYTPYLLEWALGLLIQFWDLKWGAYSREALFRGRSGIDWGQNWQRYSVFGRLEFGRPNQLK